MQSKHIGIVAGAIIIAAGAGFFGGMQYQKSRGLSEQSLAGMSQEQRQQLLQNFRGQGGQFTARAGGQNGQRGAAGFTAGEILSKDDKSITVKMPDGGSKIVFYSGSTTVGKTATGTSSDLTAGEQVTVMGTANGDGSVSAQNIQIRPAGQIPGR